MSTGTGKMTCWCKDTGANSCGCTSGAFCVLMKVLVQVDAHAKAVFVDTRVSVNPTDVGHRLQW